MDKNALAKLEKATNQALNSLPKSGLKASLRTKILVKPIRDLYTLRGLLAKSRIKLRGQTVHGSLTKHLKSLLTINDRIKEGYPPRVSDQKECERLKKFLVELAKHLEDKAKSSVEDKAPKATKETHRSLQEFGQAALIKAEAEMSATFKKGDDPDLYREHLKWIQGAKRALDNTTTLLDKYSKFKAKVPLKLKSKNDPIIAFKAPILMVTEYIIDNRKWSRAGLKVDHVPSGPDHGVSTYIISDQIVVGVEKSLSHKDQSERIKSFLSGLKQRTGQSYVNAMEESDRPLFTLPGSRLMYAWIVSGKDLAAIGHPYINEISFPFEKPQVTEKKVDVKSLKQKADEEVEKRSKEIKQKLHPLEIELDKVNRELNTIDPEKFYRRVAKSGLQSTAVDLKFRSLITKYSEKNPSQIEKQIADYLKVSTSIAFELVRTFKYMGMKIDPKKFKNARVLADKHMTLSQGVKQLSSELEEIKDKVYAEFRKAAFGK